MQQISQNYSKDSRFFFKKKQTLENKEEKNIKLFIICLYPITNSY